MNFNRKMRKDVIIVGHWFRFRLKVFLFSLSLSLSSASTSTSAFAFMFAWVEETQSIHNVNFVIVLTVCLICSFLLKLFNREIVKTIRPNSSWRSRSFGHQSPLLLDRHLQLVGCSAFLLLPFCSKPFFSSLQMSSASMSFVVFKSFYRIDRTFPNSRHKISYITIPK